MKTRLGIIGLALAALGLAVSATVIAQEGGAGTSGKQTGASQAPMGEGKALVYKTRVFRLQHCDPGEVRHILEQLLPLEDGWPFPPGVGQGPPSGPPGGAGLGGLAPGGGQPGVPPGLGLGGGALGFVGGGGAPPTDWRVTIDMRSHAVIVRASEKDLQIAADLITVLDNAPGKPLPKVKTLRAIELKHADATHVDQILMELNVPVRLVPLPEAKLIISAGPENVLNDVGDLVKELDVPERKVDPKKLKKLGGGPGT
ncbi:MAG: hypothetical protein L0Y72_06365 [Gemmataceae bacterium]|nr:hypothetical protein [Gemmataceae bacterium]MCI0738649.1 hypothetical protein [Gemmataceae bacterium]